MSAGELAGRVAFVTGAARGQGRSHAVRLAQAGAQVIALDLCGPVGSVAYPPATREDLNETVRLVEDADARIVARVADVRDPDAVRAVVAEGIAELGRVDLVIANAGILPIMGDPGKSAAAFADAVDVNLNGVFHTIDACVPTMVEQGDGGSIVITSSTTGIRGFAEGGAGSLGYAAAKRGVVGLMQAYASVLAEHSIRVNTIHPTGCATPMVMNEAFGGYVEEFPDMVAKLQNRMPVKLIEPADVSDAVLWLCSDRARYVTGVQLPVDAGFLL